MQDADRKRFADIVQACYTEVYQREPLSKTALSIWWSALSGITIEQFSEAMSDWLRRPGRGQFPPRPADVLEQVGGTAADRALISWHQVQWAMARIGGYSSVCFDDPMANLVIEQMGGWPKLCSTPEHELPFRAKDFQTAYAALSGRDVAHPAYLPGTTEISNHAAGHRRPTSPIMIGAGAQRVLESGRSGPAHATVPAGITLTPSLSHEGNP